MATDNADAESIAQHALVASRRALDAAIKGIEDARSVDTGDGVIPIRSACSKDATKFAGLIEALNTCQTVNGPDRVLNTKLNSYEQVL